jgi:hypothetical protein
MVRRRLTACVVGVVLIGLAGCQGSVAPKPRSGGAFQRERERARRLDDLEQRLKERDAVRLRVRAEVQAGRMSLLQAAAAFRDLDVRLPVDRPPRDAEGYCREVILWSRPSEPEVAPPDLVERLEAELNERLRTGGLQLPLPQP